MEKENQEQEINIWNPNSNPTLDSRIHVENEIENDHENQDSKNSEGDEKHEMEMEMVEVKGESCISKALRNPLVIKNMIAFLSWSSILRSRLVNKLWLTLCNAHLRKVRADNFCKDVLCIRFCYCNETGTFVMDNNGRLHGEIKPLDAFNDYLAEIEEAGRSGFPCKNFQFKNLVLNQGQVGRFFRLQGAEIRGLRLSFCRMDPLRSVSAESLTDLFMNFCPNVECLYIVKLPLEWQSTTENPNPNPAPAHILNINLNNHPTNDNDNENDNGNENGNEAGSAVSNLPRFSLTRIKVLLIYLLHVENDPEHEILLTDIVLSSPALERVHVKGRMGESWNNLSTSNLNYLTPVSKSYLVRHVDVMPERKNLEGLKKFAQSRPRLEYLWLNLNLVDFGESEGSVSFESFLPVASALLDSSKESLERLYMVRARGGQVTQLLKDARISTLKNVSHVGLSCKEESIGGQRGQIGTEWTNPLLVAAFNRIFPNAFEFMINGESGSPGLILNTSPLNPNADANVDGEMSGKNETKIETGRVIPQITHLFAHYAFTTAFWRNLPSLFCNLRELFVANENLLPVLPLIWQLGETGTGSGLRLKKLQLKIELKNTNGPLDQLSPALVFPGLDAAITGFPEETCHQLLSMYPQILDEEMLQEIRINSSILDLKHLEELCIRFWIQSEEELPQNVLTVVSGAYAFGRMRTKQQQQLKVIIKTELSLVQETTTTSVLTAQNQRMENILKPLKPFADIQFTIYHS